MCKNKANVEEIRARISAWSLSQKYYRCFKRANLSYFLFISGSVKFIGNTAHVVILVANAQRVEFDVSEAKISNYRYMDSLHFFYDCAKMVKKEIFRKTKSC